MSEQPQNSLKFKRDTYQTRLETQGTELRGRLDKLNNARKDTFGLVETKLTLEAKNHYSQCDNQTNLLQIHADNYDDINMKKEADILEM